MELGGNIKLEGFEVLDPSLLVVVKKIVGNYARKIHDLKGDYKELILNLDNSDSYKMGVKLSFEDNEYNEEVSNQNLFFAIDDLLNKLLESCSK
tara:strand:+ start:17726 stop:18007 length:282 start_codon:yes stop_codon:yes gene_type:complete